MKLLGLSPEPALTQQWTCVNEKQRVYCCHAFLTPDNQVHIAVIGFRALASMEFVMPVQLGLNLC